MTVTSLGVYPVKRPKNFKAESSPKMLVLVLLSKTSGSCRFCKSFNTSLGWGFRAQKIKKLKHNMCKMIHSKSLCSMFGKDFLNHEMKVFQTGVTEQRCDTTPTLYSS